MRYRICKSIEVESGHMLTRHPDKCQFPHGHTRSIEMVFVADSLDENGMVFDFKLVKHLVGEFIERFDHSLCINTADPLYATLKQAYGERVIGFDNTDPTTEIMAEKIFAHTNEALQKFAAAPHGNYRLRDCVTLESVRVWETSSSWAEVSLR